MRILVAENDAVVGEAFEEALRANHNSVFPSTGVGDTVDRLGDEEGVVVILDVQLDDGTAWEVLDRMSSPHPPFGSRSPLPSMSPRRCAGRTCQFFANRSTIMGC